MLHPNDRPIYHIETERIPLPDLLPIPPCYLGTYTALKEFCQKIMVEKSSCKFVTLTRDCAKALPVGFKLSFDYESAFGVPYMVVRDFFLRPQNMRFGQIDKTYIKLAAADRQQIHGKPTRQNLRLPEFPKLNK
jgi:hypothetical protein